MQVKTAYFSRYKTFIVLLISLVALIIADGVITHFLVTGGLATEGNPFLQSMVGGSDFLILKIFGALLAAVILWDIHRHWKRLAVVACACFVAVYTGIVVWNSLLFFIS